MRVRAVAAVLLLGACGREPAAGWEVELPSGQALDVAFDPAGAFVASVSSDDRLRLHAAGDGRVLREARGHRRGITSVAFAPDGEHLVTGGPDRSVRVWSRAGPREVSVLSGADRPPIDVAFCANGTRVVAGTIAGQLLAWDAGSGHDLLTRPAPALGGVMAVSLTGDGARLVWAADGGNLRVWSTADGARVAGSRVDALGFVAALAATADAGRVAVGARDDPWLVVQDTARGTGVACAPLTAPPRALAFDAAGERLACAQEDGRVALFDPATGTLLVVLEEGGEHGTFPRRLAFDPAGARLAAAGPGARVRVFDVRDARPLARGAPFSEPVRGTLPLLEPEEGVLDFTALAFPDYDPPELRGADADADKGTLEVGAFPPGVAALDGSSVTLRGYPLAAELEDGETRRFLLSRFPPGCCFGTVPVLDEWIDVRAPAGTPALAPEVPVRVTGVLAVGEELDEAGFAASLYRMRAQSVEP